MIAASIDQPVGLVEREPVDRRPRHLRTFEDDRRAPSPLGGMFEHRRGRREELPIQGRIGCTGVSLACPALDSVEVDASEWHGSEIAHDRLKEAFGTTILDVVQCRLRERAGSPTTVDRLREDFALAVGADFPGESSVRSACSFFNADDPDGAAYDPSGRLAAADEP